MDALAEAAPDEEYFIYVQLSYKANPKKQLFFVETHVNQQLN